MHKLRFILLALILVIFAAACNVPDPSAAADVQFQVEGELPISAGPVALEWITNAANDLAQSLDVDVSDVTYVAFDVLVWPDASYGCPQPNQAYDPSPKEGYQIQLQVNGRDYFYHGGEDIQQFLCETD